MENTSDENYNVIILVKTSNHSLSAVQYTRCAEKHRNSQSQSSLSRYSRGKGKRGKGQSSSKHRAMQSGKVQISMRDSHVPRRWRRARGVQQRRRRPMSRTLRRGNSAGDVLTSATSDDDDDVGSTSEQRRPRLDLAGDPLSRPQTTVERLGHVDDGWNSPVNSWRERGRR